MCVCVCVGGGGGGGGRGEDGCIESHMKCNVNIYIKQFNRPSLSRFVVCESLVYSIERVSIFTQKKVL